MSLCSKAQKSALASSLKQGASPVGADLQSVPQPQRLKINKLY